MGGALHPWPTTFVIWAAYSPVTLVVEHDALVGVGELVDVAVGVAVRVGVTLDVTVAVGVRLDVPVSVGVTLGVAVLVAVACSVGVGVFSAGVAVGVEVAVAVSVAVGVEVTCGVTDGVAVSAGTGTSLTSRKINGNHVRKLGVGEGSCAEALGPTPQSAKTTAKSTAIGLTNPRATDSIFIAPPCAHAPISAAIYATIACPPGNVNRLRIVQGG